MKIEMIVPLSIRKMSHSRLGSYREYLDEVISMKLRELDRIKNTITSQRSLRKAIR